jgi:hypothetical protein
MIGTSDSTSSMVPNALPKPIREASPKVVVVTNAEINSKPLVPPVMM